MVRKKRLGQNCPMVWSSQKESSFSNIVAFTPSPTLYIPYPPSQSPFLLSHSLFLSLTLSSFSLTLSSFSLPFSCSHLFPSPSLLLFLITWYTIIYNSKAGLILCYACQALSPLPPYFLFLIRGGGLFLFLMLIFG